MKNNLVKNKLFVILSMFSAVSLLFSPIIFTSASIYATDPIHILGDINNDGAINTLDVILLRLILLERADPDFHSDVDLNTIINTNDFEALIDIIFGIIDSHFGGGGGGGGGGGAVNNIPTPTPTSTPTPVTWYQDADVDGYGNPSVSTQSSTQPSGYVLDNTDCDDTDPNVHPNATEIPYNGKNDDCNSSTSDDDMDHDGHSGTSDCNDNDPAVWQTRTGYTDNDHDGYGAGTGQDICSGASLPVGYADNNTDCDDTDPAVHPNATEIPYNDKDDDCNPSTLEDDLDGDGYKKADDCDDNDSTVWQTRTGYTDNDHDGYGAGTGQDICSGASLPVGYADNNTDCDDTDPAVHPNASEIPYNGKNDDCNLSTSDDDMDHDGHSGTSDCNDNDPAVWQTLTGYTDNDHDSYGAGTGQDICSGASLPVGYADNNTDCDDTDPNVHPNATEIPYNGEDDDCNPSTLEDDLDGDGYKKDNDCDDTNAAVYPGAPEICDGIDNDCDGKVDLIDSGVHHLGDDAYSGSANSQLYIPTEGFTYSKAFTVNMTQSFTKATLSITHRGVQKDDPIKINGQLICAEWDSPSDGSLGTSTISFNINILQAGANTISITAYQDSWSHDYDDFEFTNIYIKLSN